MDRQSRLSPSFSVLETAFPFPSSISCSLFTQGGKDTDQSAEDGDDDEEDDDDEVFPNQQTYTILWHPPPRTSSLSDPCA